VSDDAPELGRVAFDLGQGAAKRRFLLALGESFLEQATEAALLALNPQKVLDLFERTRARDFSGQEQTTYDLSTGEPGSILEGLEAGEVLVADPHADEMPKAPHSKIIGGVRRLSSAVSFY
jgi:hypothetical protein